MKAKSKRPRKKGHLSELVLDEAGLQHRPRAPRDHVAQEYHDKGNQPDANDLVRKLTPRAQRCVLG